MCTPPIDPMLRGTSFFFLLKDLDVSIEKLNPVTGYDSAHTSHIKIQSVVTAIYYVNSLIS